jgi:hypothetical protein
VVAKIPEVKQAADENVNNYFNRENKILWELKSNIDPAALTIPEIILPEYEAAAWEAIQEGTRNRIITHVRLHAVAKSLECYNVLIITAGLKPSLKAKVLGAKLTGMADIKDLTLRTEQLEEERKSKSNGFPINSIDEEDEDDALQYGNNRGGYNKRHRGGHSSQYRGGRGGYQPSRGGYESSRGGYTGGQNTDKWCANCKKPTHNTAQCWTKKKINPMKPQTQQDQSNIRDPDFEDSINSLYQSKN